MKFLERSFGILLLQVLELTNAIAILAQNDQLASFVKHLSALPKQHEGSAMHVLKVSVMKYLDELTGESDDPLLELERIIGWKSDGFQKPVCLMNMGGYNADRITTIIETIYVARSDVLRTYARIQDSAYLTIILVMCAHVRRSTSRK